MIRAAGGVVVRHRRGLRPEIVVVHRPKYDDWTLPKGKLLPDEDEALAALREVEEEAGLRCVLGPEVGCSEYVSSAGPKTVRWWLMASPADELVPTKEVDEARWATLDDVLTLLDYDHDRELVRRVARVVDRRPEVVTVTLVRHATAERRGAWEGPDDSRPLTESGRRRAERLAVPLVERSPAALVSSPSARCVQSLEPLSARTGLPIQEHEALEEGADVDRARELVLAGAVVGPAVLCTHGDVQQGVIESLAASRVPLTGPLEYEQGSIWDVDVRAGDPVAARYHPPPGS